MESNGIEQTFNAFVLGFDACLYLENHLLLQLYFPRKYNLTDQTLSVLILFPFFCITAFFSQKKYTMPFRFLIKAFFGKDSTLLDLSRKLGPPFLPKNQAKVMEFGEMGVLSIESPFTGCTQVPTVKSQIQTAVSIDYFVFENLKCASNQGRLLFKFTKST